MQYGWRLSTWAVLSMSAWALNAHAESPWPAAAHAAPQHLAPLDDQALTAIQGAALDALTMAELQKHRDDKTHRPHATAAEAAQTAQTAAALNAALALQANLAMRLSTTAVSSVNTAAQIGGTLIALTPVAAMTPMGLPLFGLPSLPPKTSR